MQSIAVLMTCHNRRETTIACLDALFQNDLHDVSLQTFLVDDGSTDGTTDTIKKRYPIVNVIPGDGNLFWNRGMHLAFEQALQIGFDAYLWLNDDTMLYPQAIQQLLQTKLTESDGETIVVGAVCDQDTGIRTYGGARYLDPVFRPFLYEQLSPNGKPQEVDVFNGNVVLIPNAIARKLGNLDPVFEHGMGDIDFAMRARKLGIKILMTADCVGTCSVNSAEGTYKDKKLSFKTRISQLFSRKGQPLRSWFAMCWRHGGLLWPLHFLSGYIKIIIGRN
ncbi:MAG: glycosyltransferase family 2 protein [Methylococcaceae bacterium]